MNNNYSFTKADKKFWERIGNEHKSTVD